MPLPPAPFNTAERNLLRLEFMVRFGQPPSVADGLWLRRWRGGPQAGQPKIPAGIAALRQFAQDRRALDPKQYAHIREELGVDPPAAVDPDAAA